MDEVCEKREKRRERGRERKSDKVTKRRHKRVGTKTTSTDTAAEHDPSHSTQQHPMQKIHAEVPEVDEHHRHTTELGTKRRIRKHGMGLDSGRHIHAQLDIGIR